MLGSFLLDRRGRRSLQAHISFLLMPLFFIFSPSIASFEPHAWFSFYKKLSWTCVQDSFFCFHLRQISLGYSGKARILQRNIPLHNFGIGSLPIPFQRTLLWELRRRAQDRFCGAVLRDYGWRSTAQAQADFLRRSDTARAQSYG